MTKYDLELRFKELALARHNMDREEPVGYNDIYFQSYLDGMIWGMIQQEEIEAWIGFYERKLAE